MAKADKDKRPINAIENYLWVIGRGGILHDIELARIIAEQQNIRPERIQLFLGHQVIIIDPLFLKEKKLLLSKAGFIKSLKLYFNRRHFTNRTMKQLLRYAGYGKLIK